MTDQRNDLPSDDAAPDTTRTDAGTTESPAANAASVPPAPQSEANPSTTAPDAAEAPVSSLYTAIAVIVAGVLLVFGFVIGRASAPKATAPVTTTAAHHDERAAMAQRNEAWAVLNDLDNATPDSPGKMAGVIVGALLDSRGDLDSRGIGFSMFLKKSIRYFSEEEAQEIELALTRGSPADVAAAFKRIVAADGQSDELLVQLLSDKERIGRYVRHELPIPPEKMPDGSTP